MDDPEDTSVTLSFDLLYKGLEITTGGQRIHDYQMILEKMEKRGMDPEDIKGLPDDLQIWHAAAWWPGNRPGAPDHAPVRRAERPRDFVIPA